MTVRASARTTTRWVSVLFPASRALGATTSHRVWSHCNHRPNHQEHTRGCLDRSQLDRPGQVRDGHPSGDGRTRAADRAVRPLCPALPHPALTSQRRALNTSRGRASAAGRPPGLVARAKAGRSMRFLRLTKIRPPAIFYARVNIGLGAEVDEFPTARTRNGPPDGLMLLKAVVQKPCPLELGVGSVPTTAQFASITSTRRI